jgi:hypothetical protein
MSEGLTAVLLKSSNKPFGLHEKKSDLIGIGLELLGSYWQDRYILYSLLDMDMNKVVYIKQYCDCYVYCGEEFD